ncbi:MAG: hypothetical protein SX243_19945 [Acidobacteriota bacterium]|nr:hypothetical protein [Acidobacteriota bacterium]
MRFWVLTLLLLVGAWAWTEPALAQKSKDDEEAPAPELDFGNSIPEDLAAEELLNPGIPVSDGEDDTSTARQGSRTRELARLDCTSDIGREEITLFANGTVRLREASVRQETFATSDLGASFEAPGETTRMFLGELTPEQLATYVTRMGRIDLSETDARYGGVVGGEWVDRCRLDLALPDHPQRSITFGRFDSLSLALSRVVSVVEELPRHVHREEGIQRGIPTDYEPEIGDVLRRQDGNLFEVVLFTTDGLGVELQGLGQPVSMIVSFEDLRREFERLVSSESDSDPGWESY